MAITYVSAAEQFTLGDALPITFTTDIGTRTNGALFAFLGWFNATTFTFGAATWNGVTMDKAVDLVTNPVASIFDGTAIYYLANPANGSNEFSVTGTATPSAIGAAYVILAWVDGANQTQASILDQTNNGSGATDPSLTITPGLDNEIIFSIYLSEANSVLTAAGGQTAILSEDFGARVSGAGYIIQTTAGLATPAWTGVDDNWTMVVASFKELAAAGGNVNLLSGKLEQKLTGKL